MVIGKAVLKIVRFECQLYKIANLKSGLGLSFTPHG